MEEMLTSLSCELCKRKFSTKSSLYRHVREQHLQPRLYHCNQCELRFSKKYNLQVHMQHVHAKKHNRLICPFCSKVFKKTSSFKTHVQVHHENYATDTSSNSAKEILKVTDAQSLAESVLKELKQLQKEIHPTEQTVPTNASKELDSFEKSTNLESSFITIKDTLYPLGHFTLLQTQTIKHLNGVKFLICEFCSKEFKKTYNYLRHRRVHTRVRPFICILCKKSFPTKAQLKTHCSIHKLDEKFGLLNKLYKCPNCTEGFSAITRLDEHLSSESSCCNVTFKCPECFKPYKTLKALLRHNHAKKDNELEFLKTILPSPLILREDIDRLNFFECDFCGIPVDKRFLLKQHKKRHENLFVNQCGKCQCSFATQTSLKIHKKVHFNLTKNFKCHYCSKCFQTDRSCRRHMLIHLKDLITTEEKPQENSLVLYPTFIENKKCQIETTATPIIRTNKKCKERRENTYATKLLKYKCSQCDKSFRFKAWLKKHFIYKHTTNSPHECSNCLRKFRTKQSLENHLVVHSSQRIKCTCQVCGRQYASPKSLKVHLRIHTQENPFSCDKCPKLFRTSGHLIQHRKSNHKEQK